MKEQKGRDHCWVRHSGLITIYTEPFITQHPECLFKVGRHDHLFIIGGRPELFILRLLFADIERIDYYQKAEDDWVKISRLSSVSMEDIISEKVKEVTTIDEEKFKRELNRIVYLPETSDLYDVLVFANIFKSRTDTKKNWKASNKDIDCGITELFNVGKLRKNFLIYKNYLDVEGEV